MSLLTSRRLLLLGIPAIIVAAGVASAAWMMGSTPEDLDLSLRKSTEAGRYVASIEPKAEPVTVGTMHSWTVTLQAPDGAPVQDAHFKVGGMPQHGHGLPTSPAVTQKLGGGRYLIEGMKFNMTGWWEIDLAIDGPAGADSVTFNLVL